VSPSCAAAARAMTRPFAYCNGMVIGSLASHVHEVVNIAGESLGIGSAYLPLRV
jgi:hypothetical protein